MKKLLALLLCLLMILSVSACSKKSDDTTNNDSQDDTADVDPNAKSEGVMTYAEYAAVPSDGSTEVTIEAYVQGSQSYWNGASMYLQDQDGGYFVYNLGDGAIVNIDEENFAKCIDVTDPYFGLGKGTKVKVKVVIFCGLCGILVLNFSGLLAISITSSSSVLFSNMILGSNHFQTFNSDSSE